MYGRETLLKHSETHWYMFPGQSVDQVPPNEIVGHSIRL